MSSKLPFVSSDIPRDLRAFIDRVRELITGSGTNRIVTVGDLVSGGIAAQGPGGALTSPAAAVAPPATPTNVQASGAIQNIIVTWDAPLYAGHSHAEVWGSATDDLGAAVQLGMAPGAIFVDSVGPSVTRYYWVRFVNTQGARGAFNAVAGVMGQTGSDVEYLLDTLTDAALDPTSPYTKFAVRADLFYVVPEPTFNQEATPTATAVGDLWYQPSSDLTRTWNGSIWSSFSVTLPFVVNSTQQTINGVVVPPGVYMDAAYIKNGTITNAKIGNAAIDNAKIANLDAGKINTGFLSADRIQAGSISAAKLDTSYLTVSDASDFVGVGGAAADVNANTTTISGGKITSNSITATQIQTGSLVASNINTAKITIGVSSFGSYTNQVTDSNGQVLISQSISGGIGTPLFSVAVSTSSGAQAASIACSFLSSTSIGITVTLRSTTGAVLTSTTIPTIQIATF